MNLLLILLLIGGNYEHIREVGRTSTYQRVVEVSKKETQDTREARLKTALKGTLLEGQEPVFVEVAEVYGFDYRLLPAISFSESSMCRRIYPFTFNCWGWGNGKIAFKSFEDAIRTIGFKLATLPAYEVWREDKDNLSTLASRYCGVDNEHWVSKINYFYEKVEEK